MRKDVHESVTDFLRKSREWATPKEIIDALYPEYEKSYPDKEHFKRQVFRVLKGSPKIMRNFHSPHYAYKRSMRSFSKDEVKWIQEFFDRVERPGRFYDTRLKELGFAQYPDIPLEKSQLFRHLCMILSKLWKDPRDVEIRKWEE